jgi:hypothetical protein
MNVGDIGTRVKRQFGDESGVQLTDDDLYRYINDGTRQLILQNEELLQTLGTTSAVVGQQDYALPVDLLILKSVSYKIPGGDTFYRMEGKSFNEFNEYIDAWDSTNSLAKGTPLVYMKYGDHISVFPIPDVAGTNNIKIYYNRKPVDVNDLTDIPDIPVLYHEVLVKYCLSQAYEMDEDLEAAAMKGQQISGDMTLLRGRNDWTVEEKYPTITVLEDDL